MGSLKQDDLLKLLAQEKVRLAQLDEDREQARKRIEELRGRISSAGDTLSTDNDELRQSRARAGQASQTTAEKIRLFRHLFRGRPDVYPNRWVNASKGTSGYSPACANEWVRGVWEKSRVKCGACPNQAFLPITDEVVLNHL